MASGDVVVHIDRVMPPATDAATPDVRAGGSTPAEHIPVYDFDGGSTIEYLDFYCWLSGYGGGGLTFTLVWMATTANTGNVVWEIAIRRVAAEAEDVDAAHTYTGTFNQVQDAAPATNGHLAYATITFTDGADMDSWTDDEYAIVRVRRDPTSSSPADDMSGDAELVMLIGVET